MTEFFIKILGKKLESKLSVKKSESHYQPGWYLMCCFVGTALLAWFQRLEGLLDVQSMLTAGIGSVKAVHQTSTTEGWYWDSEFFTDDLDSKFLPTI